MSVFVAKNGQYFLSGNSNGSVMLWDIESAKVVRTYKSFNKIVSSVLISSDNRYVMAGGISGTLTVWELENGNLFHHIEGMELFMHALVQADKPHHVFIVGKKLIAEDTWEDSIKLLNIKTGEILKIYKKCTNIAVGSRNNNLAVMNQSKTIIVSDVKSDKILKTFASDGKHTISALATTASANLVIIGYEHGEIEIRDMADNTLLNTYKSHKHSIRSLECTSDGEYLVSLDRQGLVKLWDIKKDEILHGFGGDMIRASLMIRGSTNLLLMCSSEIYIYNIQDSKMIYGVSVDGKCVSFN